MLGVCFMPKGKSKGSVDFMSRDFLIESENVARCVSESTLTDDV